MQLISKAEYKALTYLITQSTDVQRARSWNNRQHYGALRSLEAKKYIRTVMSVQILGESIPLGSTYRITSEGFNAYSLYKDQKEWFTPRYVLENIAVPISIAVITTLITLLISA